MSDYNELKRLAEAATRGPWRYWGEVGHEIFGSPTGNSMTKAFILNRDARKQDGEFIAAANPAAVVDLITERDDAQSQLAALREELVGAAILLKAWSDNYAQLEQRLAAAERRNNELSRLLLIAKPYSDGEYRKSIDAALNKPEEAASHDE